MRILLVLAHFFGRTDEPGSIAYSSQLDPFSRIAAVNSVVVEFHRHFGPNRRGPDPTARLANDEASKRVLDIVMLQVPGFGLLDRIGIDPSCYSVEPFDGPPMMLAFEAQRVLRDRLGGYDFYGVIEDDMIVHDPLFFEKLRRFSEAFGPEALLQATCYEMVPSGRPTMVTADPALSSKLLAPFRRTGQAERLALEWLGVEQSFTPPSNPHARSYFLNDAQLRRWVESPWFYDRDASWVGPIESAMSLSIGRTFDLYRSGAPDPFFLSLQHYGTRWANKTAPPGFACADEPLLEIVHQMVRRGSAAEPDDAASSDSLVSFADVTRQRDQAVHELDSLKRSRSKLLRALIAAIGRKSLRF